MSNTPRTDRYELYYIETGNVSKLFNLARELERELNEANRRACEYYLTDESVMVMESPDAVRVARKKAAKRMIDMERELADMTKQRDHYKAACDQYSEDEMLCKLADVTKQRDALTETINDMTQLPSSEAYKRGKQALAAIKGESHATLQR
jgi:hypothetical protein